MGVDKSLNKKLKRTRSQEKMKTVQLVKIDKLNPHEEITETSYLDSIIKSIKDSHIFNEPIIIDKNTYVILDGHHRFQSLKKLGARYLPVVLIDYLNDSRIRVDTWYPCIVGNLNSVLSTLKKMKDIEISEVSSRKELERLVEAQGIVFGAITKDGQYFIMKSKKDIYDKQKRIIKNINKLPRVQIKYVDSIKTGMNMLKNDHACMLFIRKPPSKLDVVQRATLGKVFPPKTTRHKIPFMIRKVNIKLDDLF